MALRNDHPEDIKRNSYKESASNPGQPGLVVLNPDGTNLSISPGSSIWTLAYDYIGASYPNSTTEVYTSKSGGSGGSTQQVVTVVYTDATKANISSVTRT